MNVNKFIKYLFLINITFFISCKDSNFQEKEEESVYQIVSYLTDNLRGSIVLDPSFPPTPDGSEYNHTTQDSLRSYKYFYKQTIRKKTIAFTSEMFVPMNKADFNSNCFKEEKLLSSLFSKKETRKIEINKITSFKKDSLIYYTDKHKKMLGRGFIEIDMLLSFSRISFNKDYSKAFLIVGVTYEKLNSFTTLIYLEKKYGVWKIKCQEGLTIS
ncbi:hypothetical protein [Tenacibaculum halocynthiae]|uniref:hypothetical protein n=1 Tax=Tenacibaculum halocynthiae TaxID=1254437 RepID=UPI003895E2DA